MTASVKRNRWISIIAAVAAVVISVSIMEGLAGAPGRGAVLAGLEHPAQLAAGPTAAPMPTAAVDGRARVRIGNVAFAVRLAPNRAGAPNRITVTAIAAGRPLSGATITVAFSMPAMAMWHAFSLGLHPIGSGRYTATMPLVGMPGGWRLDATASLSARRAVTFAISDALRP